MGNRSNLLHFSLALAGTGFAPGRWRRASSPSPALDPAWYHQLAQLAERGKFDLLYLDTDAAGARLQATGREPWLWWEPFTLLGGIASVTERIGLGASLSTAQLEPFGAARQLAALDHLSGGRLAWQPVPRDHREIVDRLADRQEWSESEGAERLREFTAVAAKLWDSWEEDAVIIDRAAGRYIDSGKVHLILHEGKHFRVRGPLSIPRPPQGHPVRIGFSSAWHRKQPADLASVELLFSARPTLRESAHFRARIREQAAAQGRRPDDVKVLATLMPVLGETEEEARGKAAEIRAQTDPAVGIACLSDWLGRDLSLFSPDTDSGQIPELKEAIEAAGLPHGALHEIARRAIEVTGTRVFVGTPRQLADWLDAWRADAGSDGFHLLLPELREDLEYWVSRVVPELQRRGLYRLDYDGATLRENLGLQVPSPNRDLA
jgi:FMN-dependent oxidoreductase (nitrilotriacetate monooxygenase family)